MHYHRMFDSQPVSPWVQQLAQMMVQLLGLKWEMLTKYLFHSQLMEKVLDEVKETLSVQCRLKRNSNMSDTLFISLSDCSHIL